MAALDRNATVLQADLIVNGRHTEACEAIGRADVETLRLAEACCTIAQASALATAQPASGFRLRAQFCRRRLRDIQPGATHNRHTVRL